MSEITQKLWNGRIVKEEHIFPANGTFVAFWDAETWLKNNDYRWGSTCKNRMTGQECPVAIQKESYDLPQKWIHFDNNDKADIDGVMISDDFRNGSVKILIF